MKEAIIAAVFLAIIGIALAVRARSQSSKGSDKSARPEENAAEAGRGLRLMMLTTPAAEAGATPTKDFPRVYGILMDWPIGDVTATVLSTSTGAASLYTTSTFGIIGGEGHETVRNAAQKFIRAADRHFGAAKPTTEFPYPSADRVFFYLLTFEGVRVIETDMASITSRSGKYSELFGLGQAVLTELRLVSEKRQ